MLPHIFDTELFICVSPLILSNKKDSVLCLIFLFFQYLYSLFWVQAIFSSWRHGKSVRAKRGDRYLTEVTCCVPEVRHLMILFFGFPWGKYFGESLDKTHSRLLLCPELSFYLSEKLGLVNEILYMAIGKLFERRCCWNGNDCIKFLRVRRREWTDGSSCFHWLAVWFQMANYRLGKYLESKWPHSICSKYVSTLCAMQVMFTIIKGHKIC